MITYGSACSGIEVSVARSLRTQVNCSHRADSDNFVVMAHGQGGAEISEKHCPTLTCNHEAPILCHGTQDPCVSETTAFALGRNNGGENMLCESTSLRVRRLTPVECERLQGMPDNHTQIPWRGKPAEQCPDGPRYKAIGNSKAVDVVKWLGMRIANEISKVYAA